jgi:hypothetical protein
MSNTIRIKRSTGSSAPATLQNAEIAYSEGVAGGGTLWIGVGTGGAGGSATQVVAIGGPSTYATKSYVDSAVNNANLSSYLTTSAAASTYLSQATAASTYATQSSVSTAISNVINAAPAALDTLKELADALGSDAAFSTTVTTSLSGKMAKASNLADVVDVSAARTNLGLGTMATQAASNVAITGGSIAGIDLNGGTF